MRLIPGHFSYLASLLDVIEEKPGRPLHYKLRELWRFVQCTTYNMLIIS
jgi:hypothetical protein